jgi:ribosomal protein S27E
MAHRAYLISHLFFPTILKAFRPRSSVLVLTIPILVSKQVFFEKSVFTIYCFLCGGIFSNTSCGRSAQIIPA